MVKTVARITSHHNTAKRRKQDKMEETNTTPPAPPTDDFVEISTKPIALEADGQSIEGYIIGYEVTESENQSNLLIFADGHSGTFKLWSSTQIDNALTCEGKLLDSVRNRFVRITLKGREKMKGGKTFKQHLIQLSKSRVLSADSLLF